MSLSGKKELSHTQRIESEVCICWVCQRQSLSLLPKEQKRKMLFAKWFPMTNQLNVHQTAIVLLVLQWHRWKRLTQKKTIFAKECAFSWAFRFQKTTNWFFVKIHLLICKEVICKKYWSYSQIKINCFSFSSSNSNSLKVFGYFLSIRKQYSFLRMSMPTIK